MARAAVPWHRLCGLRVWAGGGKRRPTIDASRAGPRALVCSLGEGPSRQGGIRAPLGRNRIPSGETGTRFRVE
jgi:hypothetical protein